MSNQVARHVARLLESGWTAEEIAREVGHTSRAVYKWLHREATPRPRALKKLRGLSARRSA